VKLQHRIQKNIKAEQNPTVCETDPMSTRLQNIRRMPAGRRSPIADLLRYHLLVRVYNGDADRWIAQLKEERGTDRESDMRFARWVRSRLRRDPELIERIRAAVERTRIWR
jgi:hypothetical protein